jgi:hypothetical protein
MGVMAAGLKRQPVCVDNSGARMWTQRISDVHDWISFRDEPGACGVRFFVSMRLTVSLLNFSRG